MEIAAAEGRSRSVKTRVVRILRSPAFLATVCILVAVLVANAMFITGFRTNNPIFYFSGLASPTGGSGHFTIDPN
ncbi:MAG TPA: hypothetical protein VN108_08410, partial [Marmoricola sp.]|nr:hypothetical protein [Marmoricola sp.]